MVSPDETSNPYEREYLGRKGDHVLKLAMIMSVDESNDLVISAAHIEKALKLLSMVERNMWEAFKYVGTDTNQLAVQVLQYIGTRPKMAVTYTRLTAQFRSKLRSIKDLRNVVDLLSEEGLLVRKTLGGSITWVLTDKGIQAIADQLGGAAEAVKDVQNYLNAVKTAEEEKKR